MSSSWTERLSGGVWPETPSARLASPCVRNCCLDDKEICLGCGRSLSEILEWSAVDDPRRSEISAAAGERRAARTARTGQGDKFQ